VADLRAWVQQTPVGPLTIVVGDEGLRAIELRGKPPYAHAHPERDDEVAAELDEYFAGRRRRFTMPIDLSSVRSAFHRNVLETLAAQVSFGETVTYGELAVMAGRPGTARAVGTAMATDPVPIGVPCHRVLAAGGRVGGYGGGVVMKRALLALEGVTVA